MPPVLGPPAWADPWFIINRCLDVIFFLDMIAQFFIAYLTGNPFAGPVLSFRDREVRFVLGQGGVRDDWDIVCVWTPAMSVADAVTEALAAVNQAEFTDAANMFAEEEALSRVSGQRVQSEPDDDRRRAPSYDDFTSSGAAEAKA